MASNSELLSRASEVMPGASLGSYAMPEHLEFVVARGQGSCVYDFAGAEYIDYVLGSGPLILGHAHPDVVAAVQRQIETGSTYYALNEPAILLAEKIVAASPCAESVKFCNSGAEATFYALRLARTSTGRDKILKFEGAYHGHHDYAMWGVWPNAEDPFPLAPPDSAGIPGQIQEMVLVAPFNDLAQTTAILDQHGHEIAAIIVEPLSRMLAPADGFLEGLKAAAGARGIVLIFDEVVTGFRVAWGGAQELYGVVPDLACYGKIIGGGLPLAAVAGRRELLELSSPRRRTASNYTYVSGTLNGNPLSACAGLATLEVLERPDTYNRLNAAGDQLREGWKEIVDRLGIPAQILGQGPLANLYFSSKPITDYRSARKANGQLTARLTAELLERRILANLAAKMYVSLAHSAEDISRTLDAFDRSLRTIMKSDRQLMASVGA